MKVQALLLGAALGFLFATVPSCGGGSSSGNCSAANCGGCCDANGACVPKTASNSNTVCGSQGVACVNCTAMGKTCHPTDFVCVGGTGGGAGGGATGGGAGGGATGGGSG
ncbi:MAG: hypothetical protein AB1938_32075, partial [Myxococcota bacterium]